MLKVLVPLDGSENANRVLDHLMKLRALSGELDLHLLNVQVPIDGHARSFVSHDDLETWHREEGLAALATARAALDAAGVPYTHHIAVGHVADTIVRYATEHRFDKIVMGTHGRGALMQALLGSVAQAVLERSTVPVTLVKPAPPR
ncbi:universal stress protein [Aromatoleum petrolei]|uniref:Universal stress protein n=1 Tax=Aromatoleum petrolei TaxID=76116 RepID=A0ABX1MSW6_9RHOO|nr:universal stress protein [Aromatoleum petrolei]NMF90325.1 universal stress protein [Aromatoleum petrolei]QTQ37072.1 Universal stress protein A [Aromatoleum petrolei]